MLVRDNLWRPYRFMAVYGMHLGGYIGGALAAVTGRDTDFGESAFVVGAQAPADLPRVSRTARLRRHYNSYSAALGQSSLSRRERERSARTMPPVCTLDSSWFSFSGVADALDFGTAHRARLAELAVDGKARRKAVISPGPGNLVPNWATSFLGPVTQYIAAGLVQSGDLVVGKLRRQLEWGKVGGMEDFIGVGIANAIELAWIGQRPFHRVVLAAQLVGELFPRAGHYIQPTGVHRQDRPGGPARCGYWRASGCWIRRARACRSRIRALPR